MKRPLTTSVRESKNFASFSSSINLLTALGEACTCTSGDPAAQIASTGKRSVAVHQRRRRMTWFRTGKTMGNPELYPVACRGKNAKGTPEAANSAEPSEELKNCHLRVSASDLYNRL